MEQNINSVVKHYNRRYLKLKPREWSNLFATKIWEQTKITCAFTFKYATVIASPNAKCFVRFYINFNYKAPDNPKGQVPGYDKNTS